MVEAKGDHFKRRHAERQAQQETRMAEERKSQIRWETGLNDLVRQFDADVKGLLRALATEAPEMVDYRVYGPQDTGHQLNWWIAYAEGQGLPTRTLLVVLHYLRPTVGAGEFVPDHFSVEGVIGLKTVKPPTVEAVRKALSEASVRS
jgi:hypothetical protein